jgi:hypothetical protein
VKSYKKLIDLWASLPTAYSEPDLEANFISFLLQSLDLSHPQIKTGQNLGPGAGAADRLIYQDINQPPVIAIENKKRVPELASTSEADFAAACKNHILYRRAVGYEAPGEKGIKQSLDKSKVAPQFLASYGLVFNGDFFQLWRRVDRIDSAHDSDSEGH